MRITFVLPNASMGGGTRVVAIYAAELKKRGHEVVVVSLPIPKSTLKQKIKEVMRGKLRSRRFLAQSHLDGLNLDHRVLDTWRPVTDQDIPDADVVIATWWETAEWVAALAPEKGAKVYFIQGHEIFPYLPIARSRATYRLPLHKIVVSNWLKRVMVSEYGDGAVDVVPNSVDHDIFFADPRGKQNEPTVGVLYSSASIKGLDISLEAIRRVSAKVPNLRVRSFGSDGLHSDLPLPSSASFVERPSQDEIRRVYSTCDLWLSASRTEGFNLTAMEAMSCRTPVVCTRTGWPADAVQSGWNGVIVDIDDVAGLTDGIEWVLTRNQEEWAALSANAFATVENSRWDDSLILFELALAHSCSRAAHGQIGGKSSIIMAM